MEALLTVLAIGFAAAALLALVWILRLARERDRLRADQRLAEARVQDQENARIAFSSLAGEALRTSNEEFLKLARETLAAKEAHAVAELDKRKHDFDQLLAPMRDALQRTQEHLGQVGKDHAGLSQLVQQMSSANRELRQETGKLAQALRKPNVRGRYGEIQLERVVELAGMRAYCDFTTQQNLRDDEGKLQKPDLVVRLPNGRILAIDAKTSIDAYMDAIDAKTPARSEELLDLYAENVQLQAQRLAKKQYWSRFDASPEFVVMFIPGDQLVDAALERRPQLLDYAAENNVVIASPSTLIGLLRAVHVGWREKNLSDSAEELFELGRELHQRAAVVLERAALVGQSLDGARKHYNEFVGSVQGRLLPTLRKFEERDARSSKKLEELPPLEGETRVLEPLLPLEPPGEITPKSPPRRPRRVPRDDAERTA